MPLYIILHHGKDPDKPWANDWIDECMVGTITTTAQIGNLCLDAKVRNERVFVYRCAYGGSPAIISCSASVKHVNRLPGGGALVQFTNAVPLDQVPAGTPVQGQNYYFQ